MKMKRLAIILCLLALLCLGTLVACDEEVDCAHSAKEWVEEVSASCTVDGTVGHYVCNDCQKTLDANGTVLTDLSIPAKHTPASEWTAADGKHYHACTSCDARLDEADCAGGTATCTERAACATCGNAYGPEPSHAPSSEWTAADGKHYHACANCDVKFDEADCAGGTATCTERAACATCGNAYGDEPSHDPASEWSTENGKHYHACANCPAHLDEVACGGGRASCTERAECSICGEVYGPEPSHAPASEWSYANGKHYHACANCTTHLDETPCAGGTATCTERAECATCGNAYGPEPSHVPESEWTTANGHHYHACENCTTHLDEAPCAGGTATCTERAECATCGEEYGDLAPHEHTIETYDDDHHWMKCVCGDEGAKTAHRYTTSEVTEPTCMEEGYTTYFCACGHSYTDNETDPTGHQYASTWTIRDGYHWHAATCGCADVKKDYARHTLEEHVTAPTCTAQGYTVYTCSCGYESDPTDIVPARGHTPEGEWVETRAELLDATQCKYTVYFRVECAVCDGYDTKTDVQQRHSLYEKTNRTATCQADGEKSEFCSSEHCVYHTVPYATYGYSDPDAHVWDAVSTRSNNSNDTMTVYKCRHCEATKTQSNGNSANISSDDLNNTSEIEFGNDSNGNIVIGIDGGIKQKFDGQSIGISAGTLDDDERQNLPSELQQQLAGCDIFDFTLTASNFDGKLGGYATIRIPYTLKSGDDPDSIIVWYINNGTLMPVEAVYAVDESGKGFVTFKTDHFSYYTVDSIDPAEICKQLEKHDETHTHEVAPTCTTGGYTICLRCGEQIEGSATPARGHTLRVEVVREATCSENGVIRYTCSDCGLTYEVVTPAIGHYYVMTASVTATCKVLGSETYGCTHCGDSYTVTFPKISHTYREREVAPTCRTNGYLEKTCTACGDVVRVGIIPATEHRPGATWYTDKTHHYHFCLDCGEKMDEAEHVPGLPATEQTPQTCTICEYTLALPVQHVHAPNEVEGVAPTCTEGGHSTYYVCSCGAWFADAEAQMRIEDHTSVILDATAHKNAQPTPYLAPTCEENGYTAGVWCPDCESYLRGHVTIEAYDHDYHAVITAPTCTEEGSIVYICAHCADENEAAAETIDALGHDLREMVIAPTCTEFGQTIYTCTRCTHSETVYGTELIEHLFVAAFDSNENGHWHTCVRCSETTELEAHVSDYPEATTEHGMYCVKCNYEIAAPLAHTHTVKTSVPEQAPTCTESGHLAYYICTCGQWFADEACSEVIYHRDSVILPRMEHTPIYVRAQSATCTESGYTAGIYCQSCGEWLSGHEEIAPTGHDFVLDYDTKMHWLGCSVCGDRVDEALHEPVNMGTVAPTCTEYGHTEFACDCGHTWTGDRVRPLGHDYGEWQENGDGTHTRVCSRDGAHTDTDDCHYTFEFIRSTCEDEGYTLYTCLGCGHTYKDDIVPAHGHLYGEWQYLGNGQHQRFCQYNGTHVETDSCVIVSEVVEPTCTHRGYTTHTCEGCGHSETTDVVSALGHAYGKWFSIGNGQHQKICQNDASHVVTDFCVTTSEVVLPTCETFGYTKHTCGECGYSYQSNEVSPLGHEWGDWTFIGDGQHKRVCQNDASHEHISSCITRTELVLPTCYEDGYTKHTCIDCGHIEMTDPRPTSGHAYGSWEYNGEGGHVRECLRDPSHTETEKCQPRGEVVAPDCETGGYTEYICDECRHSYIADEVPALGHSFDENGICQICGISESVVDEVLREYLKEKATVTMDVLRRVMTLAKEDEAALNTLKSALYTASTATELDNAWTAFDEKVAAVLEATDDALAPTRFDVLMTITTAWAELEDEGVSITSYQSNFHTLRTQIINATDEQTILSVLDLYKALEDEVRNGSSEIDARRAEVLEAMNARWEAFVALYDATDAQLAEFESYLTAVERATSLIAVNRQYDSFCAWMSGLEDSASAVDKEYLATVLGKMTERWKNYTEKNDGTAYQAKFDEWCLYVEGATSDDVIASLYAQFDTWMSLVESGELIDEAERMEVIARMQTRRDEAEKSGLLVDVTNRKYLNDLIDQAHTVQAKSELDSLWSKFDQKMTELENIASDPEFSEALAKAKSESTHIFRALTQALTLTTEQKSELQQLRQAVTAATSQDALQTAMEELQAFVETCLAECDELTLNRYKLARHMLNRIAQVDELGYDSNMLNPILSQLKNAASEEELSLIYEDFEMQVEMATEGTLISTVTKQSMLNDMESAWNALLSEFTVSDEQKTKAELLMNAAREALTLDALNEAHSALMNMIAEIRMQNGAVDETLRADTQKNMSSRWNRLATRFGASVTNTYEVYYQNYYQAVAEATSNDEIHSTYEEFTAWIDELEARLKEEDTSLDEERQSEILQSMSDRYYAYANAHGDDGDIQATYYEWLTGVQNAMTDEEVDVYYSGFCAWMDSLEQDAPAIDEEYRKSCFEEMEQRWKDYSASFTVTYEQQVEYEKWMDSIKSATTDDELDCIMRDFNTWIKMLGSSENPEQPPVYVSSVWFDGDYLEAKVGDGVEDFVGNYLVGQNVVLAMSDGMDVRYPIFRDMITVAIESMTFEWAGEYTFIITVWHEDTVYECHVSVSVYPNFDDAKVIGEYVVDPTMNGVSGEWKVVLYDNGYADMMIDGKVMEQTAYVAEDELLYILASDVTLIFSINEDEKQITTYRPEDKEIGTYYYYDTMLTVYGEYHGADSYVAIVTMMGDGGMPYYLTAKVELDMERSALLCGIFGSELYFDESGNLSEGASGSPDEPEVPEIDENERDRCISEIVMRWNDYAATYAPTFEQQCEYENWIDRVKGAMSSDELDSLMQDFNTWIKMLGSGEAPDQPSASVTEIHVEIGDPNATVGDDIEEFLANRVIGKNVVLSMSNGSVQFVPITRDMIRYDFGSDIFTSEGTWFFTIAVEYNGIVHECYATVYVYPGFDDAKVIGEYIVDPTMNGVSGEWKVVLYDNGYADMMIDGESMEQASYTLEDGMLSIVSGESTLIFAVDEEKQQITVYVPNEEPIGTYYYYDTMFRVYGDYYGPEAYYTLVTVMGDGGVPYCLPTLAWLDLDLNMLICDIIGRELYFDADGNLSESVPGTPDEGEDCPHLFEVDYRESTCTEYGHSREFCVYCGEVRGEKLLPLAPHSFCEEGYCINCGLTEGGSEGGDDSAALREELISYMQNEWSMLLDELQGNIAPHYVQEYENIMDRMTWETDPSTMRMIYETDFYRLVEDIRCSQGPQNYVMHAYIEQSHFDIPGGHGYDMFTFIENHILGSNLYLVYSQGETMSVPIDWSMLRYDDCADISCEGEYEIRVLYEDANYSAELVIVLTVSADLSDATILGTYTCDLSCMGEDTALMEIYDNGYARVSFDGGKSYDTMPCYIEENMIFWNTGDGIYVLVIVDETTAAMYEDLDKNFPVIGTFYFEDEFTYTVYGNYGGYGMYLARCSMWEDGQEFWFTLAVELDMEARTLYTEMLGREPLSFDDSGNLTFSETEAPQPDKEEPVMPNTPSVDNEGVMEEVYPESGTTVVNP